MTLIAIADDSNGIYILKVSSPFDGPYSEWSAEVLCYHNVPLSNVSNDRPSLLSLVLNGHHFVDRIDFGTWNGDLPIVYRTSGAIHRANISVHENRPSRVRPEATLDHERFNVRFDDVYAGGVQMPSQTTTLTPPIKAQMAAAKKNYGLENSIGSHVILRAWGMASFNGIVAVCITLHPAKMVEYIMPNDGIATILFDDNDNDDTNGSTKSLFPWQSPAQIDVAKAQQALVRVILDQNLHGSSVLNDLDLKIIYAAICGNLLLNHDNRLQQIQCAMETFNRIQHYASIDLQIEYTALQSIEVFPTVSDQELLNIIKQMMKERGQAESGAHTPEKALIHCCPVCPESQSFIFFENLTEAYCPQGHSFGRLFPLLLYSSRSYSSCSKVRSYLSTPA